jgi:hypothetical protein
MVSQSVFTMVNRKCGLLYRGHGMINHEHRLVNCVDGLVNRVHGIKTKLFLYIVVFGTL